MPVSREAIRDVAKASSVLPYNWHVVKVRDPYAWIDPFAGER